MRGGLWKVIRSWGWRPHEWDQCPYKRHQSTLSLSACLVRNTRTRRQFAAQKRAPGRPWHGGALISPSRTVRNRSLLFISYLVYGTFFFFFYSSPSGLKQNISAQITTFQDFKSHTQLLAAESETKIPREIYRVLGLISTSPGACSCPPSTVSSKLSKARNPRAMGFKSFK